MLEIDGKVCRAGQKLQVIFKPYDMPVELPATIICGNKPGMNLLITTQIHSGEYNGSAASVRIAKEIDPEKLTGNLIIFHCVNATGFWQRKRRYVPEDMVNLNANFPGKKCGTVGHKIAAWFVEKVFPKTDFILDLHGGKDNDILETCLFYPRAKAVNKVAFEAAKKLNVKYMLASSNCVGLYGYAANHLNIPGLLVERGYGCVQREEWIKGHKDCIYLLMEHFGMYDLPYVMNHEEPINYPCSDYITFEKRGVWNPNIEINQKVKKGDVLGTLTDFFGNEIQTICAEHDGIVIYFIAGMCMLEGDEAIAIGVEEC